MIKNKNEKELLKELKEMAEKMQPLVEKAKKNHDKTFKKDIMKMSKSELVEMEYFEPTETFDSVVIVPMTENHDSDFSCMKFVLLKRFEIVGVVGGGSDVIHINGIGGYGDLHKKEINFSKPPKGYDWSIDCLPKSKCVRLFILGQKELYTDDLICSDFNIYVKEEN